jgi:heme-degrading monooxygenase HmoA
MIAGTPDPPYWAVIFTSVGTGAETGYAEMSEAMDRLAAEQPGYLGMESAKQQVGITVSYWRDLDSIAAWKANLKHLAAQQRGRETWYQAYTVRIARVERDYAFERGGGAGSD